jgi:hypothetical protein
MRRLAGRPWHSYAVGSHDRSSVRDRSIPGTVPRSTARVAGPASTVSPYHQQMVHCRDRSNSEAPPSSSSLRAPRRKTIPSRGARGARRSQAMDGPGVPTVRICSLLARALSLMFLKQVAANAIGRWANVRRCLSLPERNHMHAFL